jgi:hypothetical protein
MLLLLYEKSSKNDIVVTVGILPIMGLPLSKKMAAMWESKRAAGAAFAAPW